jgi:hypothetical protein
MRRHIAIMGMLFLLAGLVAAADADVTGTWKGAFSFNDQSVPLSLDMKGGSAITGKIEGFPSGPTEIKDARLEGNHLSFYVMIEYQGSPVKLVFRGKTAADKIDFEFGTEDGSWGTAYTAKKS